MSITNLRKVGGSVMLSVPPALLSLLKLEPGSSVDIGVVKGQLIIKPVSQPKYTLEDLLAQCKPSSKQAQTDDEWINAPRVGKEII